MTCLYGFLSLFYLGILSLVWRYHPGIAAENGLMENLQAASLGFCSLLMLLGMVYIKRFEDRFLSAVFGLLFLGCFLREVDVEKLDLPIFFIWIGSGTGRAVLIVLPAILLILLFVLMRHKILPGCKKLLMDPVCKVFLAGVIFYLTASIFDQHLFGLARGVDQFLEELLELAATFLFTVWSFFTIKKNLQPIPSERAV